MNHPISKARLPYVLHELTPELKERARHELFEEEDTKELKLEEFRRLLESENISFPREDKFLLPFLRVRKYNVRKAVSSVKNCLKLIRTYSDIFGRSPDLSAVWRLCSLNIGGFLPYRNYDGSSIHLIKAGRWNKEDFDAPVVIRTMSTAMISDLLYEPSQVAGFALLLDCEGFGLKHLIPLRYIKFLAQSIRDAFPGRLRGIHLINESVIADNLMTIVKKLLPKKMADRIHFHGTDMEGLYKHIPPSVLPQEYGGDLGPFDNSQWLNSCRSYECFLRLLCDHAYRNGE